MNWLVWRQHRQQYVIAAVFLGVFAAAVLPTGLHFWHIYQSALAACRPTDTCSQLTNQLFTSSLDKYLFTLVKMVILAVPFLLGLFWGVPLVAREYIDGTNKFIWTQGVSRRKWLTTKLVWTLLAAAVLAGAFAALATWWSRTGNMLYLNKFSSPLGFSTQGIVPIAYAVFAVAVGVALGAWLKRILIALGVTLGVLVAVQVGVLFVRPHFVAPISGVSSISNFGESGSHSAPAPAGAGDALVVNGSVVNNQGQAISWSNPPTQCLVDGKSDSGSSGRHIAKGLKPGDAVFSVTPDAPPVDLQCLESLGYHWTVQYQPASRYWDFQGIEVGLYLALSLIPIAATYWLVLRRDS